MSDLSGTTTTARRIQETVGEFSPAVGSDGSGGAFQDIGMPDEIGAVRSEHRSSLVMHDLRVDREYVYVPSGAGGYVDEFIGQFDRFGDPWWILQDANFNVLAMTDEDGDVARQVMYDAYGEPLFAEDFGAHPGLKIGHQGLFFDRLEPPAAVSGSISIGGATQLEPGVFGLYQARNRVLLSRYGRWGQKDPNASGMLVLDVPFNLSSYSSRLATSLSTAVGDGHHLFVYARSHPIGGRDPAGLETLGSMLASTSARNTVQLGSKAMSAYESIGTAKDVLGALAGGASIQQVLLSTAFELVFDKFGGSVVDRFTGGSISKRLSEGAGKAVSTILDKAHKHHVFPRKHRDYTDHPSFSCVR